MLFSFLYQILSFQLHHPQFQRPHDALPVIQALYHDIAVQIFQLLCPDVAVRLCIKNNFAVSQ